MTDTERETAIEETRDCGPPGGYDYDTDNSREASMAYEDWRWRHHGDREFCIYLKDGRQLFVRGTRIAVSPDGSLLFYTKFKDSPEELAGSYAPGQWNRFWVTSALDGGPSCIIDDTGWWGNKSAGSDNRPPSAKARERALMTPRLRYEILLRDGYSCKACGRGPGDGVALHVDHIIAIANGGKTETSNLQCLCMDCNQGKGSR